jgi:actin-related protein
MDPSRFAAGKGSALVIDIGHSTASVTPVVDGFVLRKGISIYASSIFNSDVWID